MPSTLNMTVNHVSVTWDETDSPARCELGTECLRKRTRGSAKFFANNRCFDKKHFCMPCTAAECTRLGLQHAVTITTLKGRDLREKAGGACRMQS